MSCHFCIKTNTSICPDCGLDHEKDVRKKERVQEKIRALRKAISILCNGDQALINLAMNDAEDHTYGTKDAR